MKFKILLCLFVLTVLIFRAASAAEAFIVDDIDVRGLQRISAGTVYNYLPVNVGETFGPEQVAPAIRALFKTGFFQDVQLEKEGNTLVVSHPDIAKPVAVRYGWRNTAEPKLFNKEGLPASSFCSDNWPRVTEGKR